MLRIGALNNDSEDVSEPEPTFEIRQEAQESKALGLYHKALAFQKAGDVPQAEKLYSDVLKTELLTEVPCPSQMKVEDILENAGLILKYTVYKNLGDIAYGAENFEKALDNYLEAALIDESDVSLWWRIGDIALKVTNLKLARYSFEKGLCYNPNHWPCIDNLVTVLYVIGDYAACLETIIKGLEKDDMFIKGLVIRDQIFKEESHFRKEYQEFHTLFQNECIEDYYKDDYSVFIEEALVLREKQCLLARKEDLPKIKMTKTMTYFTWACLGDCLVHLYDELTDVENPKSLCRPIDLEKYERNSEQQSLLTVPSPEVKWKGTKNTGKDDDKKSLKRKKVSSVLFEKDFEPVAKRRSARVKSSKSKEEDVNWTETLQAFLPEFLRSDCVTENEDSQESLPDESESNAARCDSEINIRNLEEAKIVSDFINKNISNSGCIDILSNFIEAVANQSQRQTKWYHGLPQIYNQIYKRVKKHVQFPCLPPEEDCSQTLGKFAKTILYALELQLDEWLTSKSKVPLNFSPGQSNSKGSKKQDTQKDKQKPKGWHEFLCDLHYILFLTPYKDILQDFWVEFSTRVYWLEARFFMLIGETKQSLRAFDKCINILTPDEAAKTDGNLHFRLENCSIDSHISLDNVQRKVESLQRCLSLEQVNKLYEAEMYDKVVDLLTPLLKQETPLSKGSEVTNAPAERPTQLLLLQDSLSKLGQIKKCIICSEIAITESVQQMTLTEHWKVIINGFLNCLNGTLTASVDIRSLVSKDVIFRLVQSIIRIIEISMENNETADLMLATTIPWLILYKIAKIFDPSTNPEPDAEVASLSDVLANSALPMPQSFELIRSSHDLLGRRGLCCDEDGCLLLTYVKDLKYLMSFEMSAAKKEDILRELEQCFYCLYGHPSKKTKSRKLQDHVMSQISLTWEYAPILYENFKPPGLPTLDNKINTISMEVQLLMRRIVAVVPQKDVEVIAFDTLQVFIDGSIDLPEITAEEIKSKRTRIQDLFYYLADFYFKNKEFSKAIKFYMHDVCLNPNRFESWAAMALARGSRLEEKISACEPKSDGPIRKHVVSTLRCFERAVLINKENCMILEEYGSTAYMLNSQASRRLREHIQDDEYTAETAAALTERRNEMLQLAEKCFSQAKKLVKRAEGEPWLHSYMLGKTAEKLKKSPDIYLGFYQLAAQQLYTANANYPKRIPYHNPPEYSIEALEMYYRVHASILNLLQSPEKNLDYKLIEEHLDKAEQSHFVNATNVKTFEKSALKEDMQTDQALKGKVITDLQLPQDEGSQNRLPSKDTDRLLKADYSNDQIRGDSSLCYPAKSSEYQTDYSPELFSTCSSTNAFDNNSQSTIQSSFPPLKTQGLSPRFSRPDTDSQINVDHSLKSSVMDISAEQLELQTIEEGKRTANSELSTDEVKFSLEESLTSTVIEKSSKTITGEENEASEKEMPNSSVNLAVSNSQFDAFTDVTEKQSLPNQSFSTINRAFSSKEEEARFTKIVDRCLRALSLCLKRFPEHYKSQYKMACVTTYFALHKDVTWSRELLLGSYSTADRAIPSPVHGLFTDRSKTNLFQYLWRIPIDEIDRRGSFCSHVCKAVELLLYVLSELKEWDTLLTISGLLHLTPSKDKKYLRDNDRAFLALKAFDLAKDILKGRLKTANAISRTEKKLLLLDCYEAYKHAQKMQTSVQITEHYLVKIYKMLLFQSEDTSEMTSPLPDKVILEQSLRFCVANVDSNRKFSTSASAHSTQGTQAADSHPTQSSTEECKKIPATDGNAIKSP